MSLRPEITPDAFVVDTLTDYSDAVAADLGLLMHELDPSFSDEPINRAHLERIIASPSHEQVIAIDHRLEIPRVVGALTVSEILEPGTEPYGYIGGVVVSAETRGQRLGMRMLMAAQLWAERMGMGSIELQTEAHRVAAIRMYEDWGATRVTDGSDVQNGIMFVKQLARKKK